MIQKLSNDTPVQQLVASWNDLWDIDGQATPMARFESVSRFVESQGNQPLLVATVQAANHLIGGMILMRSRIKGMSVLRLPNSPLFQCGALLVHKAEMNTRHFDQLAASLRRAGSLIYLDWTVETTEIRRLMDSLRNQGSYVYRIKQFDTGLIKLEGSWDEYWQDRSKNFRKKIRHTLRQLNEQGPISFERFKSFASREQLKALIDDTLAIEHRTWKGQQGSSLDADLNLRRNFVETLYDLADANSLEIHFLRVAGQRIAFDIGMRRDATYYSYKVSFDPQFAQYGPGHLLLQHQLKEFFQQRDIQMVDTIGDLSDATARWTNSSVPKYRYWIANSWTKKMGIRTLAFIKPLLNKILNRS